MAYVEFVNWYNVSADAETAGRSIVLGVTTMLVVVRQKDAIDLYRSADPPAAPKGRTAD